MKRWVVVPKVSEMLLLISTNRWGIKYPLSNSFDSNTLIYGGWIPHLTFTFTIVTIKLSIHQYRRTYSERKEVRDKVWELHKKGWGYTKIHKYLINNGYEIGKSRTTVDGMIKKMKKREYILGLKDEIRKYEDFKIQYFRV